MVTITLQILLNSLTTGLVLSLVAIGFTYIFRVTRVFHLANGGIYVAGAYSLWWILAKTDNWFLAVVCSLAVVTVLIWLIEKVVYLPLNREQSNQSISLIASMGLYIVIVNVLAVFFGNENRTIDNSSLGSVAIGDGIILTRIQIIQTIATIVTIFILLTYLRLTRSNLILHAIADDEIISRSYGINIERERLKTFVVGSGLVCVAAILKTLEVGVDPNSGMGITLTAAVVAILVSRLNILLIIAASVVLTLLQNSVEWFLNAQWRDGITFLVLLLVIVFRTEGVISYNLRKDKT